MSIEIGFPCDLFIVQAQHAEGPRYHPVFQERPIMAIESVLIFLIVSENIEVAHRDLPSKISDLDVGISMP